MFEAAPGSRTPLSSAERWVPWLTALALTAPLLLVRYPPMSDLPMHEVLASLLRHFGDPSFAPPGTYVRSFGHPNQFFYLPLFLLSFVLPLSAASKLVVAAAVLSVCLGAARLARYRGVSSWVVPFVAPLALGWMFQWGLLANLFGFGAFMALLPVIDQSIEEPSLRRAFGLSIGMVLLFFVHEAMLAAACVTIGLFSVVPFLEAPRDLRRLGLRLSPLVGGLGVGVAHRLSVQHLKLAYWLAASPVSVLDRVRSAFTVLIGTPGNALLFQALSVSIILGLFAFRKSASGPSAAVSPLGASEPGGSWIKKLHGARFDALAVLAFVSYLALPRTDGLVASFVYCRFLSIAYFLGVLRYLQSAHPGRVTRRQRWIAAAIPAVVLCAQAPAFARADRIYASVAELAPKVERGSAVAQLDLDPRDDFAFLSSPVAARIVAERGGRALFSYAESPIAPLQVRPEVDWRESALRLIKNPLSFQPAHDFRQFRYLVVAIPEHSTGLALVTAMAPEGKLLEQSGDLWLFESTLPRVAVNARELAPEAAESLCERFQRDASLVGRVLCAKLAAGAD